MNKEQLVYNNIFDAITADSGEAADLEFRADLMLVLRELFESRGWKQREIMDALNIPQPRVSELVNGKIDRVSSDKLIGYLANLGVKFKPAIQTSANSEPKISCSVQSVAA